MITENHFKIQAIIDCFKDFGVIIFLFEVWHSMFPYGFLIFSILSLSPVNSMNEGEPYAKSERLQQVQTTHRNLPQMDSFNHENNGKKMLRMYQAAGSLKIHYFSLDGMFSLFQESWLSNLLAKAFGPSKL